MNKIARLCMAPCIGLVLVACAGQRLNVQSSGNAALVPGGAEARMVAITPELVDAPVAMAAVPDELTTYRPTTYAIQPGDMILVSVANHPELAPLSGAEPGTAGRPVQADGSFFFPEAGQFKAAGLTVEQLRDTLTTKLSRVLRDPQVDVSVIGYGSRVALQGAFVDTTPQDITTVPLTLAQAVGKARIDVDEADISGLMLTRDDKSYRIDLDALNRGGHAAPDIYLKPGDKLYLPFNDRKEVYVIGEVLRPQAITFKTTDLNLTQALGRTGGLNPVTAKGKAVYVIRGVEDAQRTPATIYHLNAASPAAFALGSRFSLHPGDVVWVGPAGVTRWNRFLTQLLPTSGLINNAAAAQYNFGGRNGN